MHICLKINFFQFESEKRKIYYIGTLYAQKFNGKVMMFAFSSFFA